MAAYVQHRHLDYPELTMFQMIERIAKQYPKEMAYEFYGTKTIYETFLKRIERTARAFQAMGIGKGDAVTLCMPNIPQVLDCFYGLNRISAIANMIHPLSAQKEISFYLNVSKSKMIVVPDMFYEKVEAALAEVDHPVQIIVTRMQDELNPVMKAVYIAKKGKEFLKFPNTDHAMVWKRFIKLGDPVIPLPPHDFDTKRTSVILYSGGTSGLPKGICLTDLNFNALALQAKEAIGVEFHTGLKILSCMPCFHGFGLGINLHAVLVHGVSCILMPTFTNESYAHALKKKKPNFIAGVPTIFEALLHIKELDGVNLDFLMGMFCGGDSLSIELKKKVDQFLKDHNAPIQVREGYGLTECVTASCLTPVDTYREGSIGLPFPDTDYCIVKPGTDEEVPDGEEGEIILTGPSLMLGYLNSPEENANTLRVLADGRTWLYTGDLGYKDADGYIYYKQRIKRMLITNGYNVYPGQIENVIDSCPEVAYSCVIGVKDPRRIQRVKAYIVLRDGVTGDDACKERIMNQLRDHIARYALPREIEFRSELPRTLVGKVAYRIFEEEANRLEEEKQQKEMQKAEQQ
ncbi:MAG: acyl--CoA ligase [Clostridiales bacterium]|nr:acyl--CoA ligase [Candidatus Blautia equi]